MKTVYTLVIFLIVVVAQLFIPAQMIFNREGVLKGGVVYKFKTRPVDPADPFRGKYIALDFEQDHYKTNESNWVRGEAIYVYLDVDSIGYAQVNKVSKVALPELKKDYIMATANGYRSYTNELSVKYPFDRFYMKESKAYDAEVAVRKNQRDSLLDNVHALVYIKDGQAVLKDVIVDDLSIKDYVELNTIAE